MTLKPITAVVATAMMAIASQAATPAKPKPAITRVVASPTAVISSSVDIPAGSRIVMLSGSTASPVDPAKPDEFGDTATQTKSILTKIKATLEGMGLGMGDIVKMNVFLVAPTPGGRMDSAGMNDVFKTFFGTPEQPNRPARSTVQVAALGRPTTFVEIEAMVAKAP
ncbi:MAG: endonuclease [Sphingobium sp.]|nr:endonuclease [Sphingobium sp.]